MALTVALIGEHDGLEGRKYNPYYDVVDVLTVCDGHTGSDIILKMTYTDNCGY